VNRNRWTGFLLILCLLLLGSSVHAQDDVPPLCSTRPFLLPDGKIAFASDRDGDFDVYTLNADGSALTNLTDNYSGWDIAPTWSPDGKQIAFLRLIDPKAEMFSDTQIYVMNADGTDQRPITTEPGDYRSPEWSPKGAVIAYELWTTSRAGIFLFDIRHKTTREVFTHPPDAGVDNTNDPAWSPDGTQILFEGRIYYDDAQLEEQKGGHALYITDVSGNNLRRLTHGPDHFYAGKWSPDGKTITALMIRDGDSVVMADYSIVLIDIITGSIQVLKGGEGAYDELAWSSDNRSIAYTHTLTIKRSEKANWPLNLLRVDSTQSCRILADMGFIQDLAWQPN
jgi:TolB protein